MAFGHHIMATDAEDSMDTEAVGNHMVAPEDSNNSIGIVAVGSHLVATDANPLLDDTSSITDGGPTSTTVDLTTGAEGTLQSPLVINKLLPTVVFYQLLLIAIN